MKKTETLLIVHKEKDEEIVKKLKDFICSIDDKEDEIVGTEDGTVDNVLTMLEKDYKKHTKNEKDNSIGSYLVRKRVFIDDADEGEAFEDSYKKYGVIITRVNSDRIKISLDNNHEWMVDEYERFVNELKELVGDIEINIDRKEAIPTKKAVRKAAFKGAMYVLFPPVAYGMEINEFVSKLNDKTELRKLMLLYGIATLYYDYLDEFMKS